jgi:Transcription factor zinc-finger
MTDERATTWRCPKDGTAMAPLGRRGRGGAWRCPTCRGIFLDTEAMRRMRGRPAAGSQVLMGVFWSLLAVAVVRRLRRRPSPKSPA